MIIGHKKILDQLKADAKSGRLHHAQLFVGPKHVGKARVALEMAIILQEVEENVILRKQILEGVDSDTLLFLDGGEGFSIKEVRGIIERVSQTHHKPYLVVVIENIGRMKVEAMNTLLKTLEEPAPGVIFFLTANSENDIIPTVRSRCQITHFTTVSDMILNEACEGNVYTEPLVMYAMGRPGKLKRLMADTEYFDAHQEIHSEISRFLENPLMHAGFILTRKYEKHELKQEMLDILLHRVRTLVLTRKQPLVLDHLDMTVVMDDIETVKQDLNANVNAKLLLENLLITFAP